MVNTRLHKVIPFYVRFSTLMSWTYITRRFLLSHGNSQASSSRFPNLFNLFVLLHTFYILFTLLFKPPPNLFKRLHIPLTTSSDQIRALLLKHAGVDSVVLPKHLETLLTRLSSFDARNIFVRFGQSVLQDCEYCHTYDEYALYALPRALLEYVRETAVVGLLTINGSHKERWRTFVISIIVCAAVAEGFWVTTVQVKIPRSGLGVVMWHDVLWTYRHILFLILPILLRNLPSSPPASNSAMASLPATLGLFEQSLTRIHLLKFTRGAIMRDPKFRDTAGGWWDQQRKEGEWGREDVSVQRMAERAGLGYTDQTEIGNSGITERAKLKSSAKLTVAALKNAFNPTSGLNS